MRSSFARWASAWRRFLPGVDFSRVCVRVRQEGGGGHFGIRAWSAGGGVPLPCKAETERVAHEDVTENTTSCFRVVFTP